MDLSALGALCDVLRSKGVRLYQAHGVLGSGIDDLRLELEPVAPGPPDAAKPEADPDVCRCLHPHFAHVNGLCTMGCDVEACAPPAEAPKEK